MKASHGRAEKHDNFLANSIKASIKKRDQKEMQQQRRRRRRSTILIIYKHNLIWKIIPFLIILVSTIYGLRKNSNYLKSYRTTLVGNINEMTYHEKKVLVNITSETATAPSSSSSSMWSSPEQKCKALRIHEQGYWKHYFFGNYSTGSRDDDSIDNNMLLSFLKTISSTSTTSSSSSSTMTLNADGISGRPTPFEEITATAAAATTTFTGNNYYYYPQEMDWLEGSPNGQLYNFGKCQHNSNGIMIGAKLGNQCGGCSQKLFQPSHSIWYIPPTMLQEDDDHHHHNHDASGRAVSTVVHNSSRNNNNNNNGDMTDQQTRTTTTSDNEDKRRGENDRFQGDRGGDNPLLRLLLNERISPSLRLVERIAKGNQTFCFMGDSIDYQLYDALRAGLKRRLNLQQHYYDTNIGKNQDSNESSNRRHFFQNSRINTIIASMDRYENCDVKFNNDTGYPSHGGFGLIKCIDETIISLQVRNEDDDDEKHDNSSYTNHTGIFRWYKTYGYAPWNLYFADDCNIVSFNLGLHYDSNNPDMRGIHWGRPKLHDDFRAAIAYMIDLVNTTNADYAYTSEWGRPLQPSEFRRRPTTSSLNKNVAIWRSALPQHFDTDDGHYVPGANMNCTLRPSRRSNENVDKIQNYNKAYNSLFDKFCNTSGSSSSNLRQSVSPNWCGRYEHICTVDRYSTSTRTLYKHLVDNNCADWLRRYRGTSSTNGNEESSSSFVTGKILRWNIADLFDVPLWHFSDCSHFCYIPSLFEAALERLNLLLPPLVEE